MIAVEESTVILDGDRLVLFLKEDDDELELLRGPPRGDAATAAATAATAATAAATEAAAVSSLPQAGHRGHRLTDLVHAAGPESEGSDSR